MSAPEALARIDIDRLLEDAGWVVQDRDQINIYAGEGIAVREAYIPNVDEADYLLIAGRRAVSIVEAKPAGTTLTGIEPQTWAYAQELPDHIRAWTLPLPMLYESTGKETQFTNLLDPEPRSHRVFTFHRPETLRDWAKTAGENRLVRVEEAVPTLSNAKRNPSPLSKELTRGVPQASPTSIASAVLPRPCSGPCLACHRRSTVLYP